MASLHSRLAQLQVEIDSADAVLIGAGAGLSAAAGINYSGERFKRNFTDFIRRYGMTDMYSAGFYPFETEVEKWAYWAKHIWFNRYQSGTTQLYTSLLSLVSQKQHFVLTTNVDGQFYTNGFDEHQVFAPQGDYGKFQCAAACHDELYDNESTVKAMVLEQQDCKIPSKLIPTCPRCSGPMAVNIRIDQHFVEDKHWQHSRERYLEFLDDNKNSHVLLLEMGVGYNTPALIKYPFEQLAFHYPKTKLVRMNRDHPAVSEQNQHKTLVFDEDIKQVLLGLSPLT